MRGQDSVGVFVVMSVAAGLVAVLAVLALVAIVQGTRGGGDVALADAVLDDCRDFVAEELARATTAGAAVVADDVRERAEARYGDDPAVDEVVRSVVELSPGDDLVRGIPPAAHRACARLSVATA